MELYLPTQRLFSELKSVLNELTADAYTQKSAYLCGATIGQHVRHIIELFIELNNGYKSGLVNYEKRRRDYRLESDTCFASEMLDAILQAYAKPDKELLLETDVNTVGNSLFAASTSYHRELVYNIEHAVHHMALIRVGIMEITDIALPASFGVAAATIKHQQQLCAR